jgi:ATP-dependent Lhr-like helicase
VEGDAYSRMLAVSAAGTIPDKGLFTVKTETGVKLGEIDEEFVFEAHVGDKFLLGTFAWQISYIGKDTVVVNQSNTYGAQAPFYKTEIIGRRLQTGIAFGKLLRQIGNSFYEGTLKQELMKLGLDDRAAEDAGNFVSHQLEATQVMPDDCTIIVEHFGDETSSHQLMVHSVFGRKVNAPLSILAREAAKKHVKTNITCFDDDDGFLLFPYGDYEIPEGLLQSISPDTARPILEALLPATPIFNMTFRYNLGHALMMGVKKSGRQPLWIQRLRSAQTLDSLMIYKNHPLIRETKRECLEDIWDLQGVEYVLNGIRTGAIQVRELYSEAPSPMALPLRNQTEATLMYDYTPTPMGINVAAEEALKQVQMITPAPEQLALVSERRRLPEDEKQLHSLLMIEGDLIAGELEVPIEWLELLAQKEQVQYIEPGLWIAAEHLPRYLAAFEQGDNEARQQIVLRLIRYRGAQSAELIGERYLWKPELVTVILEELTKQGSIVESDGLYYHAELYDRARRETIKSRRSQIQTQPAERYAAILAGRLNITAPPSEVLDKSINLLRDQSLPAAYWESILLPARIGGYRPEMLDNLLSQGNLFWRMNKDQTLSFNKYEDIDWDADMSPVAESLEGNERIIYDTLLKRGASFMQRLTGLIEGDTPFEVLNKLTENGLVCADSFLPVRQLLNRESLQKAQAKSRALQRAKAMTTGRYEITRPYKTLTTEQLLERDFDRSIIVCRETIQSIPWARALETLRVWEYTGRVRRGYYINGLSGIQFIRDKDFARTVQELEKPSEELVWIPAVDPFQVWGKSIQHMPDRAFMNIAQTVVALFSGRPVAVLERQGKVLRVFEEEVLTEALCLFVKAFNKKRIYASLSRITIKQYPAQAADSLVKAGFMREFQDYVLYRGSI